MNKLISQKEIYETLTSIETKENWIDATLSSLLIKFISLKMRRQLICFAMDLPKINLKTLHQYVKM